MPYPEDISTRNATKELEKQKILETRMRRLGAPGLSTRNKKLLVAPGIATRSKDATSQNRSRATEQKRHDLPRSSEHSSKKKSKKAPSAFSFVVSCGFVFGPRHLLLFVLP